VNGLTAMATDAVEGVGDGGSGAARERTSHVQLTTGDPRRFGALAGRLFGDDFPDVTRVELAVPAR
jgi:hypothetical protein